MSCKMYALDASDRIEVVGERCIQQCFEICFRTIEWNRRQRLIGFGYRLGLLDRLWQRLEPCASVVHSRHDCHGSNVPHASWWRFDAPTSEDPAAHRYLRRQELRSCRI